MIIYSVTISVNQEIEDEFVNWMRKNHIPDVMNTGRFIGCRFSKLISHQEEGSVSYSAQYSCHSNYELNDYKLNYAKELQRKSVEKFADKMHVFRSELEVIEDYYSVLS